MSWFKNDESEPGLKWQEVKCPGAPVSTIRAAVPGGWLVLVNYMGGTAGGLAFVPDKDHAWDGTSPAVTTPGGHS